MPFIKGRQATQSTILRFQRRRAGQNHDNGFESKKCQRHFTVQESEDLKREIPGLWQNLQLTNTRTHARTLRGNSDTTQSEKEGKTISTVYKDLFLCLNTQVSYIKSMDIWMTVCMAFLALTLLEFALVNSLARHQLSARRKKFDIFEREEHQSLKKVVENVISSRMKKENQVKNAR